jgi:hypothetical protein
MSESNEAPIQVVEPTFSAADTDKRLGWEHEQQMWLTLNSEVNGHHKFTAITIKGGYVIGTTFLIAESIACLRSLHPLVAYLPTYLLTATTIELLGRCISGETSPRTPTLEKGLTWLLEEKGVVETSTGVYSIGDLTDMRNFCAHGQATSKGQAARKFFEADYELVDLLLVRLSIRLDYYWNVLTDEKLKALDSRALAEARVDPINATRVLEAWVEFQQKPYRSVGTIFAEKLGLKR